MSFFVRAVVTGFGFSLGAAVFKKVSGRLGLDDSKDKEPDKDAAPAEEVVSGDTPEPVLS
jgi:hypothetical protein